MPRGDLGLSLAVRVLRPSERARAGELWRSVEAACDTAPLAASWRWTETWLRHFGEAVDHRFVLIGDEPAAAVLLTADRVSSRRVPVRRLHLGTAGEPPGASVFVERNAILARPDRREDAGATLARWLRAHRGHDELVLDGFTAADAQLLARHDPTIALTEEASPLLDLAAARTDVLAALRSGPRRRVRQSLRAFGEPVTEWAEDAGHAHDILGELITLHEARWKAEGEPGAFADPRFRAFHHDAVGRLVERGEAIAFRARTAEGTTIGCLLSYVEDGRVLFYQSGLGAFEASAQRPGLAVHALCMQACADRGLHTYDFLAGEARYKRELSSGEDTLVWGSATRGTLRGRAMRAVRARRSAEAG